MADDGGVARRAPRAWVRYSDELADLICERVEAGDSLSALERLEGFPSRTAVNYWRRSRPDFDDALGAAQRAARRARREADQRTELARRLRPRRRDGGHESHYTPQLGEAICARLANGESVLAIAADPDMPCAGTIYRWARRFADFQDRYAEARALQGDYLFDEAREVARAATPARVWVARLQFDVIRWQTARLAPKKYCERLVVAGELAAARAETAAPAQHTIFSVTHFEVGPDRQVLCAPPRNPREEQAWIDSTGQPYQPGVGPKGEIRPPRMGAQDAAAASGTADRGRGYSQQT